MDEVVEQLGAAAISTKGEKSSFVDLYKNRGRLGNQDERRRDILDAQKVNRHTKLDRFRGVLQLVEAVEEDIFRTPKTFWNPTIYVSGFNKIPNYCDVLMMSEWMYKKPVDFEENWLAVPCPKGMRMLVVAHKGTTKFFNKYGNFRFECRTMLPGGNPCEGKANKHTVVLDCFYGKDESTVYVLDILAWNNCVMTEGEASFRHYWMSGQLSEIPELTKITKKNTRIFKVIPKIPCTKEALDEFLMTFPYYNHNMPPVDGLLFYHQKAQYFSGETPLVGWLYPFMIHEVLGPEYKVHKGYMLEKPVNYIGYMDFIEKFENKKTRKKQRMIFKPRDVETGLPVDPQDEANARAFEAAKRKAERLAKKAASQAKKGTSEKMEECGQSEENENKTMDSDNNILAQGDNAASESTNEIPNPNEEAENAAPTSETTNGISEKMEECGQSEQNENKTMDTDNNILAQGDNAASESANENTNLNEEESAAKPVTQSEKENMEAMVADIVEEDK